MHPSSPDAERSKLKQSKQSLTKTYYDLQNLIKIARERKSKIKEVLDEEYEKNERYMN